MPFFAYFRVRSTGPARPGSGDANNGIAKQHSNLGASVNDAFAPSVGRRAIISV
jgi:hypothetical protein